MTVKIKHGFYATLLLGAAAGLLRVVQYLFTIGYDGYTDPGAVPAFLQGMLAGLLAVGVVAALLQHSLFFEHLPECVLLNLQLGIECQYFC